MFTVYLGGNHKSYLCPAMGEGGFAKWPFYDNSGHLGGRILKIPKKGPLFKSTILNLVLLLF